MSGISGIKVWDSATNFLLFKTLNKPAVEVHNSLKRQGVLIKLLDGSHPVLEDCLRVTVGTTEENDLFMTALGSSLE